MKKLLILFILFYVAGCANLPNQNQEKAKIDCPRVFFSSENNVYINNNSTELDLDKINYKAKLNNYAFSKDCFSDLGSYNFNMELLIITEPINPNDEIISLPIFVLIYDIKNNLIEKQYFRIEDKLNYNNDVSNYVVTDVIGNLNITLRQSKEVNHLVLGFVNLKKY